MNRILSALFIILIFSTPIAHAIELEKKDYLSLVIGNYVHGFKEFETSVTSFEDSVSIGIYFDASTQEEHRANQLANRFRSQVPIMLKQYKWAKDVVVKVNVYSEDRTGRGY